LQTGNNGAGAGGQSPAIAIARWAIGSWQCSYDRWYAGRHRFRSPVNSSSARANGATCPRRGAHVFDWFGGPR